MNPPLLISTCLTLNYYAHNYMLTLYNIHYNEFDMQVNTYI
jgi:hypothetical protein